ncbi:MAG TPA: hypothetical protein VMM79_20785, partial [Longimicrobiales bacterium]|nr:hypothetical protein [Longimicrobiales bacterium]
MIVSLAALADAANVSKENKLNLTGIYDTIHVTGRVPYIHDRLVFAFQFRAEYEDANRSFDISVELIDTDSRPLWNATGHVTTGAGRPGVFAHLPQIVDIRGVRFDAEGRYRFRIRIDGG